MTQVSARPYSGLINYVTPPHMFGRRNVPETKDTVETIIGPSVKVEGDFVGQGDVVVEGSVFGNLHTDQNLRIGPQAEVRAEVKAANAFVAGQLTGNVTVAGTLEVAATARITGDIAATTIAVEAGAVLNGKVTMAQVSSGQEARRAKRQTAEVAAEGGEEL